MKINRIKLNQKDYYSIRDLHPDQKQYLKKLLPKLSYNPSTDAYLVKHSENNRENLITFYNKYNINVRVRILKGNKLRIGVHPGSAAIEYIKTLPYYSYDSYYRHWTIPFRDDVWEEILIHLKRLYKTVHLEDNRIKKKSKKYNPIIAKREVPRAFIEKLKELRYSKNTINIYRQMFSKFLSDHYNYRPDEITNAIITKYLRHLVQEAEVSRSYQNQMINAIKFYYERVLGSPNYTYAVDRPRKERGLPIILSKDEVKLIFSTLKNEKHLVLLSSLYALGLRIGEALNLKREHINFKSQQIHLVRAKGGKDRIVPMPKTFEKMLANYLKKYNPEHFVFQGQKGGKYSSTSVRNVIKNACAKAKITKTVTAHTFRHSFATHLLESGVSIRSIQILLGHNSIKTTEIYTQVSTVNLQEAVSSINSFLEDLD